MRRGLVAFSVSVCLVLAALIAMNTPAGAAHGDVHLGSNNTSSAPTTIDNTGSGAGLNAFGRNGGHGVAGFGDNSGNAGVLGKSLDGIAYGVIAQNQTGVGLLVDGRMSYRRAGSFSVTGTVQMPKSSAQVNVPLVSGKSHVLAVVETDLSGVWVARVVLDPGSAHFTVHLNAPVTQTVNGGYFIFEVYP